MSEQRPLQIVVCGGQQIETTLAVVSQQRGSPDDSEMRFLFNQNSNYLDGPHPLTISTPLGSRNLGAIALLCTLPSKCRPRPALWLTCGAMLGLNQLLP